MVEDLLVEVLDTCICAWVNSKPDFPHYFLCKKSFGIVTAMGAKDTRENPTIYTVLVIWGKTQAIFCPF
jgi:hypothetical protein